MPKPFLREPYASLESDIAATMIAGLKEWRRDLNYPESHSDLQGCIRALLRKYEVKLRAIPLDRKEITELPEVCPVCQKSVENDHVTTLKRFDETRQTYAHMKCVNKEIK